MLCCKRGDDMYRMTEMALKWDKIRVELVSHLYEMKIHLGKIYFYRDFSDYIRGWKITCMKGFEEVPRMKHNNKFPTFEKLYECLWEEREDVFNVKGIVEDVEYFCEELPIIENYDEDNFKSFCEEYIRTLCEYVSEFGGIRGKENSDLIDELLDKYPYERK